MSDKAWSEIATAIALVGMMWALAWCTAQPTVCLRPVGDCAPVKP